MDPARVLQLMVEPTVGRVSGVRVAGELTAEGGLRLLRLLDDVVRRAEVRGGSATCSSTWPTSAPSRSTASGCCATPG